MLLIDLGALGISTKKGSGKQADLTGLHSLPEVRFLFVLRRGKGGGRGSPYLCVELVGELVMTCRHMTLTNDTPLLAISR